MILLRFALKYRGRFNLNTLHTFLNITEYLLIIGEKSRRLFAEKSYKIHYLPQNFDYEERTSCSKQLVDISLQAGSVEL